MTRTLAPHLLLLLLLLTLCLGLPVPGRATEVYTEGEIVVTLNPGYTIEQVNATWGTTTIDEFPEGGLYLLYKEGVADMEAFALQMQTDPAVSEAEANYFEDTPEGIRQMVIVAIGGDWVDYEDQAITERIGLDEAHTISMGHGVTVGILDSGIDPDHEAFAGRLAPGGYDFVGLDAEPWEEANGVDDDGDGTTDDGYGHGSMVAGIVALVAPQARILPVRVLDDEGRAEAWTIAQAVRYAVDHGADVLNMSFGVPRTISMIGHQIDYADQMGIPVVAGAGNENTDEHTYFPAAHSSAMMITALDSLDIKADFADWKSKVLVSAPGTGVRSAYPGGQWGLGAGCSFATPFVTGEVALILGLAPDMPNDAVEARVEYAVDPIYHLPPNQPYDGKLGSGRVFLPRALDGLVSSAPPETWPESSIGMARGVAAVPNPSSGAVTLRLPEGDVQGAGEAVASGSMSGIGICAVIYDAAGRRVRGLAADARGGTITWDGRDDRGEPAAPGAYYAIVWPGTARGGGDARRAEIRLIR